MLQNSSHVGAKGIALLRALPQAENALLSLPCLYNTEMLIAGAVPCLEVSKACSIASV